MTEVNLELWKNANAVYAKLMDLTVSDALNQLSAMDHLDDELKSIILTLISSGNQPSQYFKQHISANFQLDEMSPSEFKSGDEIDGYELLEELGVGGMARVYKARKIAADSQKPVAIKLFNRSGLSPILLNRFSIEQDVLSGLSHPNIVNMHHGGTSDQGVPYIVMELIDDAQDIDQYAKSHQASLKQKITWVVAAAKAIAYAHNNLIVHRDIKPSNLLVDINGQLKVVDFGIAKLLTKEDAPQKTTIMALTPSFAAPEQINSGPISVTTDVFSLAVVCLSLIIEDLPLPADRLLKSCSEDEAHIWHILRTKVADRDLRNILNQALQTDSQNRYRNMDLFADDLNAWLDDKPVLATPDSWLYRLRKFAKRRSALFATLLTLVLTLSLAVVVLMWQYNKTKQEAQKALEVKNFMLNVFSVAHPDVNLGQAVSAIDLLQKAKVDIDSTYQSDPKLKAELLLAIGTALYQVGDWEKAKDTLFEAYQLENKNPDIVMSYAEVMIKLKQVKEVTAVFAKHEKLLDNLEDTENWPRVLRLKAAIKEFDNQFEASADLLQQAYDIDQQEGQYKSLIEDVIAQVKLFYRSSQYDDGIAAAEAALEEYEQLFPPANSLILHLKNELSVLYTKTGQFDKSQVLLEQMVALEKQYLGDEHPDLIQSLISLSESYYSQGQLDLAHDISQQAHELTLLKFGTEHPKVIDSLTGLATVVFVQGDYEQALSLMNQAIVISVENFGESHVDTLKLKRNYATALSALRRNEESKEVLLDVYEKQKQTLGAEHNDTLFTQLSLVRTLGSLGQNEEAVILAEETVAITEANYEPTEPISSNAQFALGFAYFDANRFENAIAAFLQIEQMESKETANYMVMCKTLARSYVAIEDYENAKTYAQKSLDLSNTLVGPENIRTTKVKLLLADILVSNGEFTEANKLLSEIEVLVIKSEDRDKQSMLDKIQELRASTQSE